MRFMFKTDYEDDIRLFPHSGYVISYGILLALLLVAPFVLGSYIVSQLVFVCIYATVGVGLMILTGFTGQGAGGLGGVGLAFFFSSVNATDVARRAAFFPAAPSSVAAMAP